MAIYNFHRVLISCAILFLFGYALYAYRRFGGPDSRPTDLVTALIAGALSVVMVAYLIYFNYNLRHRRRAGSLLCPACGYDLRGSVASKVCPECGAALPLIHT